MFSGRAEASYVQLNSLCLKAALIWPPSRLVHLWLSLGCEICEPSRAGVAVGSAGCFQCFYLFPDFNTSSFSMNQDLTQQADSGAVAFLFWPVLMESWSISSVVVVVVVSVWATGGYFLFRRLCLPVFLGAASCFESLLFLPLCHDKDCDCTESGEGMGVKMDAPSVDRRF